MHSNQSHAGKFFDSFLCQCSKHNQGLFTRRHACTHSLTDTHTHLPSFDLEPKATKHLQWMLNHSFISLFTARSAQSSALIRYSSSSCLHQLHVFSTGYSVKLDNLGDRVMQIRKSIGLNSESF